MHFSIFYLIKTQPLSPSIEFQMVNKRSNLPLNTASQIFLLFHTAIRLRSKLRSSWPSPNDNGGTGANLLTRRVLGFFTSFTVGLAVGLFERRPPQQRSVDHDENPVDWDQKKHSTACCPLCSDSPLAVLHQRESEKVSFPGHHPIGV